MRKMIPPFISAGSMERDDCAPARIDAADAADADDSEAAWSDLEAALLAALIVLVDDDDDDAGVSMTCFGTKVAC